MHTIDLNSEAKQCRRRSRSDGLEEGVGAPLPPLPLAVSTIRGAGGRDMRRAAMADWNEGLETSDEDFSDDEDEELDVDMQAMLGLGAPPAPSSTPAPAHAPKPKPKEPDPEREPKPEEAAASPAPAPAPAPAEPPKETQPPRTKPEEPEESKAEAPEPPPAAPQVHAAARDAPLEPWAQGGTRGYKAHRGPDEAELIREEAETKAEAEKAAVAKKGSKVSVDTLERLAVPPKHWANKAQKFGPREPLPWSGAKVIPRLREGDGTAGSRLTRLPKHRQLQAGVAKAKRDDAPPVPTPKRRGTGAGKAQRMKPEVEARLNAVPAHRAQLKPRPPRPELSDFSARDELLRMKLSELRKHALDMGLEESACEEALDSDAPKDAMVSQVLAWTDAIRWAEEEALKAWEREEEEERLLRQQAEEYRRRAQQRQQPRSLSTSPRSGQAAAPALRVLAVRTVPAGAGAAMSVDERDELLRLRQDVIELRAFKAAVEEERAVQTATSGAPAEGVPPPSAAGPSEPEPVTAVRVVSNSSPESPAQTHAGTVERSVYDDGDYPGAEQQPPQQPVVTEETLVRGTVPMDTNDNTGDAEFLEAERIAAEETAAEEAAAEAAAAWTAELDEEEAVAVANTYSLVVCRPGSLPGEEGIPVSVAANSLLELEQGIVSALGISQPPTNGFGLWVWEEDFEEYVDAMKWKDFPRSSKIRLEPRAAATAEAVGAQETERDIAADVLTAPIRYKVLASSTVRSGPDSASRKVGEHKKGTVIEVVRESINSDGLVVFQTMTHPAGWVKLKTSKGNFLVEKVDEEERGELNDGEPDATAAAAAAEVPAAGAGSDTQGAEGDADADAEEYEEYEEYEEEDEPATVDVVVPDDCEAGDTIALTLPDGLGEIEVVIPDGLVPGDVFEARIPMD